MVRTKKKGSRLYASIVDHIRAQPIIWHFCTPKSASTFLMQKLIQATADQPNVGHLKCLPIAHNRAQAVCPFTIAESIGDHPLHHVMIARHVHAAATTDLLDMISENHLVVVQTRPVFDTVISAIDHLNQQPISPFCINGEEIWPTLSESAKIDYLTLTYVPWHVQFIQSWDRAAEHSNIKWASYQDVVDNPDKIVSEILAFHGIHSAPEPSMPLGNIRFNVGRSGRGQELLSPQQKPNISSIVETMSGMWQPSHFAPAAAIAQ